MCDVGRENTRGGMGWEYIWEWKWDCLDGGWMGGLGVDFSG